MKRIICIFSISIFMVTSICYANEKEIKDYMTVLVLGVDSRNQKSSGNTDVIMIGSYRKKSSTCHLISLYRDLEVYDKNIGFRKINSCYLQGYENTINVINDNYDLNISKYLVVNWDVASEIIDYLGGVDINITEADFIYLNSYIHETYLNTKYNKNNPAECYVKSPGLQHLTGLQAVAYSRLRKQDNDYKRTERQREVVTQCTIKFKALPLNQQFAIGLKTLQGVKTNINYLDIIDILACREKINITEVKGEPHNENKIAYKDYSVWPKSLEEMVSQIHNDLYDSALFKVSDNIKSLSKLYEKEKSERKNK